MKKYQNRSRTKRKLFEAVLRRRASRRLEGGEKVSKRNLAQTMVVNAFSAAAFMSVGATAFAKEDPSLMPEVVVTGRQEKDQTYKAEAVSSSKYTAPLRDIPQTITVVPKAVMQEQGATTLREVLRDVPGISIQAGEGGVPAGDNLSIRGFNARTDIFIDGVRDFGGYSRDTFNVDQVEVTKGPASAYAGRGSTGGSINMATKAPELDEERSGTLGGGTDKFRRVTLDVNEPLKNSPVEGTAVRFNAMYHGNDTPGREEADNERWGVAPSIAFGLGTGTRTTLSFFHLGQSNAPDYGIPWVPVNAGPLAAYSDRPAPVEWSNYYGLKDRDYEKTTTDIGTAKIEHDFNDSLTLRNQIRYGETYRDSIITAPRFASVNISTAITRTDWKSRDQLDTILDNQTDLTIKFETAGLDHTLVPGLELLRETDINYTRVKTGLDSPTTDLFAPNPEGVYRENIQRNGARTETTADSVGLYAFDTMKVNDHWEVNGGVRWDYFDLDYTSINPNGTVASDLGRIDRMTSWRTGVVYKPQEYGSIYAAVGTSFNPAAEGLTLATTATAANNLDTDPEESRTYEIGTKWDLLEERLSANAAVFRTDKTNARTEDPANSADTIVLDGRQRVDGIELGLSGNVTEKWKAMAGYTLLKSEIVKSNNPLEVGNALSNTPEHTVSLWNTYQLPKNFEIGGGVQFVDARFSSNQNNRQAPEYVLADAMAAYKVNKDVTLRLNAYNLGDVEYIDRVGGGHFIPGAGRSATLTTEFKF